MEEPCNKCKILISPTGRGTHLANYSTTLGACVHELGHTFDLAHTPHGIMCRGHDDMNHFYTLLTTTTNTTKEEEVVWSSNGGSENTAHGSGVECECVNIVVSQWNSDMVKEDYKYKVWFL